MQWLIDPRGRRVETSKSHDRAASRLSEELIQNNQNIHCERNGVVCWTNVLVGLRQSSGFRCLFTLLSAAPGKKKRKEAEHGLSCDSILPGEKYICAAPFSLSLSLCLIPLYSRSGLLCRSQLLLLSHCGTTVVVHWSVTSSSSSVPLQRLTTANKLC